ncbi:MAG: hypothetical protein A3B89_01795 [Candidatus Buchananbacteria bacterium RIFCSPHIGHO2_02_FULL_40_13]|uniref:DUF1573 domain-containing protein n=1 Tax=Candidatus Buchananbacteria bacterium RIFCSPLOWO2_01_FULL_39_33 TaxID=1797543 RepID=A0A1G1YIV5_9BACT|nr:MAG: hypothetical protein A3B89_01795 [Candidatus Buchananbacteria bacterium RIFCSPHIGHO2_02_FULL_40_13]OGY52278.1 MAG: hypothetical protein A3A02_01750 [Candidatus Buchananbacteria bacterium RIFCSPLOWO2_01_FULL_39_33]
MNNKTLIIIITLIIIVFVGLVIWSQSLPKDTSAVLGTNDSQGFLSADETSYDFGTISMANKLVNKVFKVTNTTNQEVSIDTIVTSCMCTTAYLQGAEGELGPFGMPGHGGLAGNRVNETIKPGETRDLKVVFDPNAHGPAGVGAINRSITLTGKGGKLQFTIEAVVTP